MQLISPEAVPTRAGAEGANSHAREPSLSVARANGRTTPDQNSERERLILENMSQVCLVAKSIRKRLPNGVVALEDLVSTGIIGLIGAIDRFDASRNVGLETYASYKIRGAILDSLRNLDWASREQRRNHKKIEAAISSAEQRLLRAPSEEEIASSMNLTLAAYHRHLLTVGTEWKPWDKARGNRALECIASDTEEWPSHLVERSERKRLLADAINRMPRVDQTLISLYYRHGLTLREIGRIVKASESQVCQRKARAIVKLRAYLEERWPLKGSRVGSARLSGGERAAGARIL